MQDLLKLKCIMADAYYQLIIGKMYGIECNTEELLCDIQQTFNRLFAYDCLDEPCLKYYSFVSSSEESCEDYSVDCGEITIVILDPPPTFCEDIKIRFIK